MFVLYDIEIPETKKEPKKETKQEFVKTTPKVYTKPKDVPMPSDQEILLAVFSNRSKEYEKIAKETLEQIKSGKLDEKPFSQAQLAEQVICASPNGVILAFEQEMDAKLFNKSAKKKEFLLSCCRIFRNPKFVVGFTPTQINNLKNEMLLAKKNPKPLLDLDALRTILNKDASIEQIAFNTIYSMINKKDNK
ncbi:MAG: hypothetical protein MJ219_02870 [Mycoplasmoidaceae bacterium]|nr:hypothetical protein [Mycoplasmoidaceae bacterium]